MLRMEWLTCWALHVQRSIHAANYSNLWSMKFLNEYDSNAHVRVNIHEEHSLPASRSMNSACSRTVVIIEQHCEGKGKKHKDPGSTYLTVADRQH